MSLAPVTRTFKWPAVMWGLLVTAAMAAYYYMFYFPPRLVGLSDTDRFYHLGLSKLMAAHGLLRTLPQAEDLGWGRYFPDKEFGFHVLTGLAAWMGGSVWVLMLTPILGTAIIVCLYVQLTCVLRPWRAALLSLSVALLTAIFIFRLTLLRPHLLAILCFCLLLAGFLNRRAWLTFFAAAGFALSYHAFYVALAVIAVALPLRIHQEPNKRAIWRWALAGVCVGILINPYFPSNLVMSWMHLQIALHVDVPPDALRGNELHKLGIQEYLRTFGFLPFSVLAAAVLFAVRRLRPEPANADSWFLLGVAAIFVALSLISVRAIEYAVPACILLIGYAQRETHWRGWQWASLVALLLLQGGEARRYYREIWSSPMDGGSRDYLRIIEAIPASAHGAKVFNCEWDLGGYLLDQRPDLRFVDLLDPVFLWKASPSKYQIRMGLLEGIYKDPQRLLRDVFKADYVLCRFKPLIAQMYSDRAHFKPIASNAAATVWLFQVLGK